MKSSPFPFLHRLRSFASLTGVSVLDQAVVSGMNFAVAIYLAKALGLAVFGSFSILLVLLFFFLELFRAVIIAPFMTFAAQIEGHRYRRDVLWMGMGVAILLGGIGAASVALSGHVFPQWGVGGLGGAVFWLIAGRLLLELMRRFYFIESAALRALGMDVAVSCLIVMGLAVLASGGQMTLPHVLSVHGAAYGLIALLQWGVTLSRFDMQEMRSIIGISRKHWDFGRWLMGGSITLYASSNLLLLMAATILGRDAAGLLKAAQYTMGGMIVLFQAIDNILPYRFAYHVRHDPKAVLAKSAGVAVAVLCAVGVVHGGVVYWNIALIAEWLAVSDGSLFTHMVVLNIVFSCLLAVTYVLQYTLRAFEHTKTVFLASGVTACLSIAFGSVLIHNAGVLGVLYGFLTFQIITIALYARALSRYWGKMK